MNSSEILEKLDGWVKTLVDDAKIMRSQIDSDGISRDAQKHIIGGLSYLLRKVDIIPDYMGGIGVLDDAFVMRVACRNALKAGISDVDDRFKQLAEDAELVDEILDELKDRFNLYVDKLPEQKIRNRNADTVLDEPGSMEQFDRELEDEIRGYKAKPLGKNEKVLRELKSFIKSKIR
ncbi:MAG: YkvA family protein [Myxococcota bacterium]